MGSLVVRDVSEDALEALGIIAARVGLSREAYMRQVISREAKGAIVPQAYQLRFGETTELHQSSGRIMRYSDGATIKTIINPTAIQIHAYQQASVLVERNAPGDKESAIAYLQSAFPDVYEYPISAPAMEIHSLGSLFEHDGRKFIVSPEGLLWRKETPNDEWRPVEFPLELGAMLRDGFQALQDEIKRLRLKIADLEQGRPPQR